MFRSRSSMLVKVVLLFTVVSLTSFNCNWYKNWRAKKAAAKNPSVKIVPDDQNLLPMAGGLNGMGSDNSIPWGGSKSGSLAGSGASGDPLSLGIGENDPLRVQPAGLLTDLDILYFEYDSYTLTSEQMQTLDKNTEWLQQNAQVVIQIEGHCDERGTFEYNMNLGQKRADAVREYLTQKGVDPNRLYTISYGEERPMELSHDDSSFSKNRRVQFLAYGE